MKVQRAEARVVAAAGAGASEVVNQAPLELLTLARDSLDSASSASVASSGLRRLVDKRRGTVRLADSLLVRQSFHAWYTSSWYATAPAWSEMTVGAFCAFYDVTPVISMLSKASAAAAVAGRRTLAHDVADLTPEPAQRIDAPLRRVKRHAALDGEVLAVVEAVAGLDVREPPVRVVDVHRDRRPISLRFMAMTVPRLTRSSV